MIDDQSEPYNHARIQFHFIPLI